MPESLGARLRRQREDRQIPLGFIAEQTKISLSLLQGLEADDVSRWPTGIFRRSFVRSYAEAIGLDADEILKEFLERFPDPWAAPAPAPAVESETRPHERRDGFVPPDRVELVLRLRVPRWCVEWLDWAMPRLRHRT